MVTSVASENWQPSTQTSADSTCYTRVAMWLHWTIAILIIWNLVSGLLIWDFARDFFKTHRAFYGIGITTHLSAGMTVLALTVVRIVWRLTHEPPPYPATMKPWERHAAHFAHFLLYAGMVLMPLLGWAILSAHPPAGSAGAKVALPSPMAASPVGKAPAPSAGAPQPGPMRAPPPPGIWWIIPLPTIAPIGNIGLEPGGVKPQHILHEEFAQWHKIGGYLMLLLLFLHIGGALKHQFLDKEPELQRMGAGKRRANAA